MDISEKIISDHILNIYSLEDISINLFKETTKNLKINTINIQICSLNLIFIDQYIKLIKTIFEYSNLETIYLSDKIFFRNGIYCDNFRINLFKDNLLIRENTNSSKKIKNIIIQRTKFIDIENISILESFIDEYKLKGYNIIEKKVIDNLNIEDLCLVYGEHDFSDRYINLNLNKILSVLKFEDNIFMEYFKDIESDENGIYDMPNMLYYTNIFDKIKELNKNIPEYYLKLSYCLSLLSLNLKLNEHNIKYYISVTYLYISHWIIDDIFDKNKSLMKNKDILNEFLLNYLDIFDNVDINLDYEKIKSINDNLINKFKFSVESLKISIQLLNTLLNKRSIKLLKNYYEKSILIFLKKVDLNIESSYSIDYYTENRSLSTGCLPYICLKYFAYSDEMNVPHDELIDFINKHEEIKTIERYANLYDGFIDDYMTPIKDYREDTANLVYTVSNINKKLGIYESSILSLEHTKGILNNITTDLKILMNKLNNEDKKYLHILSKSYYNDMFGIVIFHFYFQNRYSDDMCLLKIMNNNKYENKEKKRIYNEKGKCYLDNFRITSDDLFDEPSIVIKPNESFLKIKYGNIFETKKETSQFKIRFDNNKKFTDAVKNLDNKIQNFNI